MMNVNCERVSSTLFFNLCACPAGEAKCFSSALMAECKCIKLMLIKVVIMERDGGISCRCYLKWNGERYFYGNLFDATNNLIFYRSYSVNHC